ncbi:MAG: EAL domain-containing protein [Hahellaceae bacterium]|nr:EAL domain-containing protein [Hahellaceae bacterium]
MAFAAGPFAGILVFLARDTTVWQVSQKATPNFGYSKSTWWFALPVVNASHESIDRLVEVSYPPLDEVDFIWQVAGQHPQHLTMGDRVAFSARQIAHRNYLFSLTLAPMQEGLLILKVRSSSSLQLPLVLFDPATFHVKDQFALTGQMLYFGAMLVMVLFNAFLYLSLRERVYLHYILFVTCFMLVQACLHGFPNQFFFQDTPWLQDQLLLVSIPGIVLFASLFTRNFLSLQEHSPRFNIFFIGMAVYAAVMVVAGLFVPYSKAILFNVIGVLPASLGCLIIGPVLWKQGHRIARFYTLAWLSITIASFLLALNKIGLLPRNFFTENGLQFGSVLEAILLSLALADRLNFEREARFKAQQRVLEETQARRKAEERLIYDALHVPLTGLPNRVYLEYWYRKQQAAEKLPEQLGLGLFFLSRFHEVNKTLGHEKADQLLKKLATSLNQKTLSLSGVVEIESSPMRASIASVEGVSFGILFENPESDDIKAALRSITSLLAEPIEFDGMMIDLGGTTGVAIKPDHGQHLPDLIRNAQIAIDMSIRAGQLITQYHDSINPYNPRRLSLAGELRRALKQGGLYLVFQPKVRAQDGQPCGLEALLRWEHEQLGFIPPDEFIPIAEQTGIIHSLTEWVLQEASRHVSELRRMGYPLTVAINISAINLKEKDLVSRVRQVLKQHEIVSENITLEVTESALMENPEHALLILNELSGIGVRLSIDDFGTGYSSLAYLKKMPVQEIKIDRSFVMDMDRDRGDAIIVHTTVNMCHDLGLQVVAEGVETAESQEQLKGFGCDYLQGYLLSRPLKFPDLLKWLAERSGA